MTKKRNKIWAIGAMSVLLASLFSPMDVQAANTTETLEFPTSFDRVQTKTFELPEKSLLRGISVNTGRVSYSQSGNELRVTVSSGVSTGTAMNDQKYALARTVEKTSKTNVFPETVFDEFDGYSGYLPKNGGSVMTGEYVPYGIMYISNYPSPYFSENGYYGYLSQYVASGSYTAADSKTAIANSGSYTYGDVCEYGGNLSYKSPPYLASSMPYSSGGYTGTLYLNKTNGTHPDPVITCGTGSTAKTGYRYAVNYDYRGTVTKPASDTRVYRYEGSVRRDAVDTREYKQSYSGNIYKGELAPQYAYNVSITYEIDDEAPIADVSKSPSTWTNQNVSLRLLNIRDIGWGGFKQVTLPNGTVTTNTNVYYTVTENGNYDFLLEDRQGNKRTETVVVDFIDKLPPSGSVIPEVTGWTNLSYLLTLTDIADEGVSGVKHVVMPNGQAMAVGAGEDVSYMVSQNGTYNFTIVDNAGNQIVKSHAVTNIDKTLPSGSLSYDNSQLEKGMKMTLNGSDSLSGLASIKMPDGTMVDGTQAIYYTSKPGNHVFEVTDKAGNVRAVTGTAMEPEFTVTRSNLSYVVSVSRRYWSVLPTITHLETGEVITGTYKVFPITGNGKYSFEVNDGGIKRTEVIEMNDYYNLLVPKVTITYPNNGWTRSSVQLYVRVTSEIGKSISGIVLPDGTVRSSNYAYYNVYENGIYTFQGFDSEGTYGYGSVKVTNIDSKAPTIEFTTPEEWVTEDPTISLDVTEE